MVKKILKYFGLYKEKRVEDPSVKGKPVGDLLSAIDPNFKPKPPPSVIDKIREKDSSLSKSNSNRGDNRGDGGNFYRNRPVTVNDLPQLTDKVDSLKSIMEEKELIKDLVKYQKEIVEKKGSIEEKRVVDEMELIDSFFKNAKVSLKRDLKVFERFKK